MALINNPSLDWITMQTSLLTFESRYEQNNHFASLSIQPTINDAQKDESVQRFSDNSTNRGGWCGGPNTSRGSFRGGRRGGRGGRPGGQNNSGGGRPFCHLCEKHGHLVSDCYYRFDKSFQPPKMKPPDGSGETPFPLLIIAPSVGNNTELCLGSSSVNNAPTGSSPRAQISPTASPSTVRLESRVIASTNSETPLSDAHDTARDANSSTSLNSSQPSSLGPAREIHSEQAQNSERLEALSEIGLLPANIEDNILRNMMMHVLRRYAKYGDVSPKIDVYAFGVVLYELVSAKEAIVKTNELLNESKALIALAAEGAIISCASRIIGVDLNSICFEEGNTHSCKICEVARWDHWS
ncbi:chitin elicitor receptor kinase 1-like [Senna tora]|uniref:Chitin elicitor receptor kinase 1-like n=1 Tax=Senna tora TaxID=362788 RepID=A0A835CGE1_9FABA|nr:chitin elicitor receptor kinase 1-like [Senna tora]